MTNLVCKSSRCLNLRVHEGCDTENITKLKMLPSCSQLSKISYLFSHRPKSLESFLEVFYQLVFAFIFCLLVGMILSLNHSDQMSQRSQVSRVALWWRFSNRFFHCHWLCLCWSETNGHTMSLNQFDQMYQSPSQKCLGLLFQVVSKNIFVFIFFPCLFVGQVMFPNHWPSPFVKGTK